MLTLPRSSARPLLQVSSRPSPRVVAPLRNRCAVYFFIYFIFVFISNDSFPACMFLPCISIFLVKFISLNPNSFPLVHLAIRRWRSFPRLWWCSFRHCRAVLPGVPREPAHDGRPCCEERRLAISSRLYKHETNEYVMMIFIIIIDWFIFFFLSPRYSAPKPSCAQHSSHSQPLPLSSDGEILMILYRSPTTHANKYIKR